MDNNFSLWNQDIQAAKYARTTEFL
uniref:Uncharacterized protein n=1 Tax=Anguilla anguilla TaxID=7936 RepID=A0A0E9UW83_ANGAN